MIEQIRTLLRRATFYRCVLLVNPDVVRLGTCVRGLADDTGWPVLSLGPTVARALLSSSPRQRPGSAQRIVRELLGEAAPGPLICSDIDLLFEPSLALDPLVLLREASRATGLVVAWPGSYSEDTLTYAAAEHAHYRAWKHPEVQVCPLGS